MLAALVAGERDPKVLAQLARQRLRAKLSLLEEAFHGRFSDITAACWPRCWIASTSQRRDRHPGGQDRPADRPFSGGVVRLDEICGVGRAAAQVLIAEIGVDMGRFPTPG